MKKATYTFAAAACLSSAMANDLITIIPRPVEAEATQNHFTLNKDTAIRFDARLEKEAKLLASAIKNATGIDAALYDETLKINLPSAIHIDLSDAKAATESYTLNVTSGGVTITGADAPGAFYGAQSLLQLIPVEGSTTVPGCTIKDAPRFGWRGMHLDVGRHMFDVADIKKFIDWLAVHKMNTLHWHLTEDQGWRIEIKKYPKLTSVGGFRASTPPYGDRGGSDGKRYGGFYTQEQIKDIVAYAAERHITIVPEIDMPGHMAAAIAAYPELGNDDIPNYAPEVKCHWGVHPYTLAPKESTFTWVDDVLTEVCALFPSTYIHIGGDEAPKDQWHKSKFAQSVIKREGLKDEHELQSYFIKRVEKMLEAKGRKLIGWDEIREGGLSPNATMMLWRGWEHAVASINEGHDVVMAPGSHTYFDHYQNFPALELAKGKEFECIGGHQPISNVYTFNPIPKQFRGTPKAKHVLGCQAQLWTEYMKTWDKVEYCAFPRIAAIAEVAWTPVARKDYQNFLARLEPLNQRYLKAGVNAFDLKTASVIPTKDGTTIKTSLPPHGSHFAEMAYNGSSDTFFWSGAPARTEDHFTLILKNAVSNKKISITTGHPKKGGDTLQAGVVEASTDGKTWSAVTSFENGKAEGTLPANTSQVRIRPTKAQNQWLVIQEISIH